MHHFDDLAQRTTRACLDYALERLRLDPAPLDHPVAFAEIDARAHDTITREGRAPEDVLGIFTDVLAPACLSTDSPRFLAFIPAAPTKASLVFDTVVAASSMCATSWLEASGAVYAENQALRVLADLAGMPPEAGGCFVSGGSAGNLSALYAARDAATRRKGRPAGRWRVAVGETAHSSILSTLRIIDCDPLVVPAGSDDRLTGDALAAVLATDADPASVFAVAATAGTTNAGLIDDLRGIGDVARARDLWFHVDGAYGGAALFASSTRDRFAGVETADSFLVDPHKWLFAPFDSCALLYRDPELARAAHAQEASYLDPMRELIDGDGAWNPSDYAYHLSRRARGLPLWFSLAVHGTDAYADAVERVLALTRVAAARVRDALHVALVAEPELSVVLFRRPGWEEADYHDWSRRLLDDQIAFALPTRWRGELVGRAVFLHPETTIDVFDEVLAAMA
ncbi:MAG TPA: pyridoxal-dependent decarboxylase [Acidimicrobiia bacterium]|nr:pyridoxal-dependent decarboxylase [Acidimicrobiia bacterium]